MPVDVHELWKHVRGKKNVTSYSGTLQKKIKDGKERRSWAFRVYVKRKVPLGHLSEKDIIPAEIDGVPTDVMEVGEMNALDQKANHRPIMGGISAMFAGGTACTLGWFAYDKLDDNKLVIIANNHCTCDVNKLSTGHGYVQTSPMDTAHGASTRIGGLKRYVPIVIDSYTNFWAQLIHKIKCMIFRCPETYNPVDLGIVEIDDDIEVRRELYQLGSLMGKRRGTILEWVEKMGRTTGHTDNGVLIDNDWYGEVGYGDCKALMGPCGLISGTGFCKGGDSSSAIRFKSDQAMAGLLFAGSLTHSIFCHWDLIEAHGDVEIVT
jgi:hypothetical protein